MAQTKVSALTALTATDGNEELLINDGGTSKKVTIDNVLHDNSIRAEHYVDGSIATAHIADNAITSAKLGVDVIVAEDIANNAITVAELANNAVTTVKILDDNVTNAKMADNAIDTAQIADDAVTAAKLANSINTEITANTAKTSNATHSGEVTGATALTIADNIVDEANLKVSNAPTNGYVLTAQSGDTGGLTWAADANTTYSVGDGGLTTNDFTNADHSKLNAIEAGADVTDTTNVTAAGALMDSELAGIAAVKATTGTFLSADESKLDGIAASANNYVHPNHSGEVTSSADGATVVADNVIDEANLKVSNAPTNGHILVAQSGNTGGLTWTAPASTSLGNDAVDSANYVDGSIDREHLAADIVDGTKIADNAIDSEHYTDDSIDAAHLANSINTDIATGVTGNTTANAALPKAGGAMTGAITTNSTFDGRDVATDGTKLDGIEASATADQTAAQIKTHLENGIDSVHYVDGSIDREHLAADIIDGTKIANDVLNSEHYIAGSIDAEHIASDAVTTAKIAGGNVTVAKMAANSVDSNQYVDGSIDAAHLASNAVTTAKINTAAVTSAKIANDNIDSQHYAADSIDTEHYAAGSVDATALASNAVTEAKLNSSSVATAKIADNAVTLAKMASGTDGNIISYDASGNPVAIATGSDGQVLTSTGAGSPPAFETPSGGGTECVFYTSKDDASTYYATNTYIKFVTNTEVIDSDGGFASSRYTVPSGKGGTYFFTFNIALGSISANAYYGFVLRKNGSATNPYFNYNSVATGSYPTVNGSRIIVLAAGDYVELWFKHTVGGSRYFGGGESSWGGWRISDDT